MRIEGGQVEFEVVGLALLVNGSEFLLDSSFDCFLDEGIHFLLSLGLIVFRLTRPGLVGVFAGLTLGISSGVSTCDA